MNSKEPLLAVFALVFIMTFIGCAKPYVIFQDLEEPIPPQTVCSIGRVQFELPEEIENKRPPNPNVIPSFKKALQLELVRYQVFDYTEIGYDSADYEIRGYLLNYRKGDQLARFFFGGLDQTSTEFAIKLELVNLKTDEVVFSGNFVRKISKWTENEADAFKYIGQDFAGVLEKQLNKLE